MKDLVRLAKARVHFIGIGGIGMCGLAELLHNMGVQVKGSDLAENQQTLRLRELGIKIQIGHVDENMEEVDVAVYSSAVKPSNVEFKGAKKRGIPLIPRAEALAEIMRLRRGVAIAGSHGKTTTTSMAATIFLHARFDPTIVVGGRLDLIKSTAKLGSGEWMIAEADESDGSFNRLAPEITVITNIDNDHLDHFGTMGNLEKAFVEFASRIPFYGVAIVCGDSPRVRELFNDFPKRLITYGFDKANDYHLEGNASVYKLYHGESFIGEFRLFLPGRHNALNALAAILSANVAGVPFDRCLKGIETYMGVDRRFQKKASVHGVDYYDDYGHHPTEVEAVLAAFKEQFPDRRLVVLFQPHRFSRTQSCWADFLKSFKNADSVGILDIYPAGEAPIAGVTAEKLCAEMKHKDCEYLSSKELAKNKYIKFLKNGDIFLTL
ncbi:MAG: UDP-N-acetylmuramate--L-alanine ligase, partial [Bdellovibrionales bacterium]|nr:UDP-N-acetylmuramate--L-alanine ligase [Bdellovibrionales bacterium]